MEDVQQPPSRPRTQGKVLLLTVLSAGIGGTFQFGYNLSIINAPTLYIQAFTNETWLARTGEPLADHLILLVWSLIVSLYPLGGLVGALLAGHLAIALGRKKSLLVNDACVVAAAVLFGFSRRAGSFEMILLGRLLVGVGAGLSMNVQPMYLGESAPKELRGATAMSSAIFTALGIVMGQVMGLRELLGGQQAWPLLLASCVVPGLLQLISLPLLPESPRYLLIDRGDTKACLAALQRLRGTRDVALELAELQRERAACGNDGPRRAWQLFSDRALRRQVMSLVVLGSAMELCGNDSVYAYASSVFRAAGMPDDKIAYALVGTGSCELLASVLSCVVVERVGRRLLLMGGYSLMTCSGSVFTVALCLQDTYPWMPYLAVSCVFSFILSFGIGPAGVTGILATELFDQTTRPAAYVICGVLMWAMLFLVGLGFPFLMEALSNFLYVPFLCICVCGAVYTGFFLPETKGKTFLEISQELHRLNFPGRAQGPTWIGPHIVQSTEL
ncbi:solute carrier family 2, facilitated glucose transporter member 11 isoform X1 [Ochotona princeps]|uniref:solute carrier family 2, facilitated glucose transporter member 11 isoform X1 n=1 Tax=Ochotona princeps TaxID=9978 RepID=UPI002714C1FA|nr:solute carrier family 2, facilitated glucose transporter member 11 isoform X1 [Ochotona princeps]XP_058512756.1 solute carrier family 2, facilitated glucose transporter member 11 isoform X1 [Ochotona princeps]